MSAGIIKKRIVITIWFFPVFFYISFFVAVFVCMGYIFDVFFGQFDTIFYSEYLCVIKTN